MPSFVIQQHNRRSQKTHWDLMLKEGKVLKTFRIDRPPEKLASDGAIAEAIADHDLRFLSYEGTVQNGLGDVRIVERGQYEFVERATTRWQFKLWGSILRGHFVLETVDDKHWILRSVGLSP